MKTAAALCSALFVCAALPACAQDDVAAFYKGKQLRMIVGSAVGGGYDLFARIVARHIVHHIPGHPTIIVQNQPSAGGVVMTNQLYGQGPKDGTVIGVPINGLPTAPLLQSGTQFDATKLIWIGSTNREAYVAFVWHTAPVREHRRTDQQGSGGRRHHAGHHDGRFPAPGERRARLQVQDRARLSGHAADQSRHRARRGAGHGRASAGRRSRRRPRTGSPRRRSRCSRSTASSAMRSCPTFRPCWSSRSPSADRQAMTHAVRAHRIWPALFPAARRAGGARATRCGAPSMRP